MIKLLLKSLFLFALTIVSLSLSAQEKEFEEFSKTPKDASVKFPLDYKISRPRLEFPGWDVDLSRYDRFLTTALRKTQASLDFTQDGIMMHITPNSIVPHAQLDTLTIVDDPNKITGTWRMLRFRSIRFTDSLVFPEKIYYRLADTLLDDKSNDEAYAVFTDNNFKLYAREAGKTKFRKMMSAKYTLEGERFMLVYKLVRSGGGVSQVGIDEKGFLILNYPKVVMTGKPNEYVTHNTVIEQYIFQKVK